MYHHIGEGPYSNGLTMLKEHLVFLKDNYPNLLPGDTLSPEKLSVCLTFDDAPFNFFHYVFPLLMELRLRAIVAVPTRFIVEKTNLSPNLRLRVPHDEAMEGDVYKEKVPFCTWEELRQMVLSSAVEVASHSHNHFNMSEKAVDRTTEVISSKQLIEDRLPQKVSTFIYPFGKVNRSVHEIVKQEYPYAMRIGNAFNENWGDLLYRVNADNLKDAKQPFFKRNLARYALKSVRNKIFKPKGFFPWDNN